MHLVDRQLVPLRYHRRRRQRILVRAGQLRVRRVPTLRAIVSLICPLRRAVDAVPILKQHWRLQAGVVVNVLGSFKLFERGCDGLLARVDFDFLPPLCNFGAKLILR